MKKKLKKTRKPAKKAARRSAKPARKTAAKKKVQAIPAGYHSITAHLVCRNAAGAIDFYKKAFGARELGRMPMPDGKIAHAEIRIGDSRVMLGDEMPEMGASAPETVGGTPVSLFIYTKNVDQLFARAVGAGARGDQPPMDMFWGDRYAKLTDPFGHRWSMATHIEDMTPKEMARRGAEFFGGQG